MVSVRTQDKMECCDFKVMRKCSSRGKREIRSMGGSSKKVSHQDVFSNSDFLAFLIKDNNTAMFCNDILNRIFIETT